MPIAADVASAEGLSMRRATRGYRIGVFLPRHCVGAIAAQQSAAARLGHQLVTAADPTELGGASVDFALIDAAAASAIDGVPSFAVVDQPDPERWYDHEWLHRLAAFDGYLTISPPVRKLLDAFILARGQDPYLGAFDLMPKRQAVTSQIERIVELGAFRLCHITDNAGAASAPPLITALANNQYLRQYVSGSVTANTTGEGPGKFFPLGDKPERLYTAFGGGLLLTDAKIFNPTVFRNICSMISVGAVALCPNVEWLSCIFGDNLYYYPTQETPSGSLDAAVAAIDAAVATIVADPRQAAQRAAAARSVFETEFAAEVMLQNAVELFARWEAQPGPHTERTVRVDTVPRAIADLFARVPNSTLECVARSIATIGPLQPVPDWRFGAFNESRELATHVRHSLWLAGRERGNMPVTVPWHAGTRLKLHLDNDLSRTLFAGGMFEPNEFALLDRVLEPGMVFLDGGANEGAYTVFAAARVGRAGRVIAVEPSSREAARLKANIALNRLRNVEIVEQALAECQGTAELQVAETEHSGQNTLGRFVYAGVRSDAAAEVGLTTLDDLAQACSLSRLDVLKLDIEGAELRALQGGRASLATWRPLILLEVLEPALVLQGCSLAALFEFLVEADYRLFEFDPKTGLPTPFDPGENQPRSDNIVAMHRERVWQALADVS